MDQYYLILLAFLGVIALIDLFVGVSNDAVNFLNSALGCRITSFRTTLWVASLGVLAGATFSSGMMEIARSGVFHPQLFTFSELMIIFFAVMVADVILLDAFNSMGLPTSTTVSIVFELLGSAFAAALFKLIDAGLPLTDVANYINSSKSLGIVSGILISVVVAFISGAVVQYLARLAFSFRFENAYRRIGAIYGGLALTAIIYFLVMKGAKGASFMRPEWISWINDNTAAILFTLFAGLTVFFQILIVVFRVNIFKIIILAGTFSLAFAFAGNDLVNFVGVPLAAWDSFQAWKASGVADTEFLMGGLLKPATAPTAFLLLSGFVMVLTLWFSKKAHRVIQTSINLSSSQSGGQEQFDATTPGRMIVRAAMSVGNVLHQIIPLPIQRGIQKRFEPLPVVKGEVPLPFDYVRASINLMVSAILIASATSLKLPLSTTYVTFMVAMGSSFADGAWDRESAVYRISGVLTVISGWFLTAISASSLAAVVAVIVFWGGEVAAILLGVGAVFMLVRSNLKTQNEGDITPKEARQVYNAAGVKTILANIHAKSLAQSLSLLTRILEGFTADAQRELTRIRNAAEDLHEEATTARKLYYRMAASDSQPPKADFDARYLYLRATTNTREVARAVQNLARLAREHVANRHRISTGSISRDIATLVLDIKRLVKVSDGTANLTALREEADGIINRIESLQHRLMALQPQEKMTVRSCEFYLSYLLVLRELVNHYEIASMLEDRIDQLARHPEIA